MMEKMESNLPLSIGLEVFPVEGRGLVAKQQFAPGDMLISSKPYAHVIGEDGVGKFCGRCVKLLSGNTGSACEQCGLIRYCSTGCEREDEEVHRSECAALRKFGLCGLDNIRLLLRVLETRGTNKTSGSSQDPVDLLSYTVNEPSLVNELYTKTVIRLVQSLLHDCNVTMATDTDAATISTLLSKLAQNSFSLYHGNQRIIGSAVHIIPAMMNHSCSPNCWWTNEGPDLFVHSNQAIQPGEQLRVTYASVLDTREERQEEMREKYHFECKCTRCIEENGIDRLLASVTCPACDKVATSNRSTPKTDFPTEYCSCVRQPYCYGGKTKKQKMKTFYRKWRKITEKGSTKEAYHKLLDLVGEVHVCFPAFSRITIEMNESILTWAECECLQYYSTCMYYSETCV
jgi:SET and MYND domain-containing protein